MDAMSALCHRMGVASPSMTSDHVEQSADRLARMRAEYGSAEKDGSVDLDVDWLDRGWLALFRDWMADAVQAGVSEPNAMVLGTVDGHGHPVTR